jgi:hypothetical protein
MISARGVQSTSRHALLGLACAVAWLGAGCGDGRVRVNGSVMFEGKPLEEGFIASSPATAWAPPPAARSGTANTT